MERSQQPLLQARGLRKNYGDVEVLHGVDLDVHRGEVVSVIGPSGSGKSTLLRCLNCLEWPDGGSVHLDGELIGFSVHDGVVRRLSENRIAEQRRVIGMVFQNFNLFPNMTVLRNLMEGPRGVLGVPRGEAENRALAMLEAMQLSGKERHYPRQLSGGQQQRVAIARSLLMNPKLLLFDEPTSALDSETVGEVRNVMRRIAADGMTMVVVTHEIRFAREISDRVVFMEDGQVVEQGPPEQVLVAPETARAREFLRREMADE